MFRKYHFVTILLLLLLACKKDQQSEVNTPPDPVTPTSFTFTGLKVNDVFSGFSYYGINMTPVLKISFSAAIDKETTKSGISLKDGKGTTLLLDISYEDDGKTVVVKPSESLQPITKYVVDANSMLKSTEGKSLTNNITVGLVTAISSTDKFPILSDEELLTKVQQQTFKYFYDFGHPQSGMIRERNSSGDLVTSGGTGFGVMALVTGVSRNFITRSEGLARVQKIVNFLKTANRFHGAYPHWLNGNTGAVIPFSQKDNGGDLVETSLLMQGLITARQFFNGTDPSETTLRTDITNIYNGVEWDWYRKDNSNVLYWHWSPEYNWDMNLQLRGWNEGLITYVLAAASTSHTIPKSVYDNGWAQNGAMKNGNSYYGLQLPLGPNQGGPLFFSHYSFLGINPFGLTDAYANYETQNKAHALINYNYCKTNPKAFYGYSENCWGLTASDIPNGYTASSPTNDVGVIAPTAAIASLPYTPEESMKALRYFYYKLGDKIFKEYGFVDAFSLHDQWFATSTLAIDQGPIIIMIENHRSKLLWNLFMSAPEVKAGLQKLGFTSPNL